MKGRYYCIKYILSNGKVINHQEPRSKIMKEWDEIIELPVEKVNKFLKLNKGVNKKDKDVVLVSVVEGRLLDWVGNLIVSKVFKSNEIEDNRKGVVL